MVNYIYTLTDPEDNEIKYIGKTYNLKNRLYRHTSEYSLKSEPWTRKNKWIKYLKNKKLKPIIEILDIGDENNINELEKYWIGQFKCWGFRLKNSTEGGDGVSWLGKKHSDDSKKLMKLSNPNKKMIIMLDRDFNPIKKFISIRDAERETNIHRQQIIFSCKLKGTAGGCYFRYDDNFEIKEVNNWKDYIEKRDYGMFDNIDKKFFEKIVEKSKSYSDVAKNLNIEYPKNKKHIYRLIKRHDVCINHFTRKIKKHEK